MDSDSDDDPIVKYGTAMKLPDRESSQSLKYVPVHEQIVTDEEGRRRFHGAFTGGFSAGYYNTVGTKEGWTPSTFVSSRSKKSERKAFQPQDFMDDEDKSNLGISTVKLRKEFLPEQKRTSLQQKQLKVQEQHMTLSLGADLLDSIVVAKRSNVGFNLLRLLGWREGRQTESHIRRQKKDHEPSAKVYGCQLPSQDILQPSFEVADRDADGVENLSFAPIEVVPERFIQKDNYHGIGYNPLNPSAALHTKIKKSTSVKGRTKSGSKLSFVGQAFGVGAFEEDDEDIYSVDSMQNYDSMLSEEANPDSTYGWTRPLAITSGPQLQAIDSGRVKMTGFVPAKHKIDFNANIPPPIELPHDFDPLRRRKLYEETIRIKNMNLSVSMQRPPVAKAVPTKYDDLSFDERRSLLSDEKVEESAKKPITSVFDLISAEDRERMEAAKRKATEPEPTSEQSARPPEVLPTKQVDPNVPLCHPTSIKPFSGNPEKQRRYDQYERAVRQRKRNPYAEVESNLTEWERNREREEFSRAAQIYTRLSSGISSRFTKASSAEAHNLDIVEEKNSVKKITVFGVMTRDQVEWHPDPLLCKRFNVPNPHPESDFIGTPQQPTLITRDITSAAIGMHARNASTSVQSGDNKNKMKTGIVSDTTRPPVFGHVKSQKKGRWDEEPVFSGPATREESTSDVSAERENEEREKSPEGEAPTMELFKSIFADDDDEEEESSGEDDVEEDQPSENMEKASSPPRHTSAADVLNRPISFSASTLNGNRNADSTKEPKEVSAPPTEAPPTDDGDGFFGPTPPPKLFYQTVDLDRRSSTSDSKSHKKHSKHKKHKKNDKKHKKKKHK